MAQIEKKITIHTARTLMTSELTQVLEFAAYTHDYKEAMDQNVAGKRTKANQKYTYQRLRKLYKFDLTYMPFLALRHFWQLTDPESRPILAFLYSIEHDYLLRESLPVVLNTNPGNSVTIEQFKINLMASHADEFSPVTQLSIAQNLSSSYKQAGYLKGKVKVFRVPICPTLQAVTLAALLAYIRGIRGEFILHSPPVQALELSSDELHRKFIEASHRGYMTYQRAGNVTSISFDNLLSRLVPNAN